jgi:hypothetical protein
MLRRLIGQPSTCTECIAARGSCSHVQDYTEMYLDSATGTGQWLEAANRIGDSEQKYFCRRAEGLRELVKEAWETELRARGSRVNPT